MAKKQAKPETAAAETKSADQVAAEKAEAAKIKAAEAAAAKEAKAAAKLKEKEEKAAAKAAEKAAADKEKADAKAAAEADKVAKKEAAEKAKADKVAAAEAAKAAKEAGRMPIQNGIRRPRPEGKCGQAWALMDAMSAEIKAPVAIADLLVRSNAAGLNPNMVRSNYAVWRKFNGVSGRVLPVAKQAAAPAEATAA